MQSLYNDFIRRDVKDIPVEDASPEFARLRDMVDLTNIIQDKSFPDDLERLTPQVIDAIQQKRRLWKKQIQRCFEIFRYMRLDLSDQEAVK